MMKNLLISLCAISGFSLGACLRMNGMVKSTRANVLILGCSLDRYAVEDYCHHYAGANALLDKKYVDVRAVPEQIKNTARSCTVKNVTIAWMFQPGAGDKPYSIDLQKTFSPEVHDNTKDIAEIDAPEFGRRIFNAEPHIVVVDSSLRTLTNWWQRHGKPSEDDPEFKTQTKANIERWCTTEVPQLLRWVQGAFPQSRIVFRTAPTVVTHQTGQTRENIEMMRSCILNQVHAGRLFGSYELLDYHRLMDDLIETKVPNGLPPVAMFSSTGAKPTDYFFRDGRHPNEKAGQMYMEAVLKMTKQN